MTAAVTDNSATDTTTTNGPVITPVAPTVVTPTAAPAEPANASDADTKPVKRSLADLIAALPEDDQKVVLGEVTKARTEAKGLRERLKTSDETNADVMAKVAQALGVAPEQTAPDPAALATQLAAQTSTAAQAQRELAVYRAAGPAGADPNALLDSVSFMRSLADVDPTDSAAVTEAVAAAVKANAALGLAPVKRLPGPNPALGTSSNGAPDLEALIADAQKRGDFAAVIRLQNQKLSNPAAQR